VIKKFQGKESSCFFYENRVINQFNSYFFLMKTKIVVIYLSAGKMFRGFSHFPFYPLALLAYLCKDFEHPVIIFKFASSFIILF